MKSNVEGEDLAQGISGFVHLWPVHLWPVHLWPRAPWH